MKTEIELIESLFSLSKKWRESALHQPEDNHLRSCAQSLIECIESRIMQIHDDQGIAFPQDAQDETSEVIFKFLEETLNFLEETAQEDKTTAEEILAKLKLSLGVLPRRDPVDCLTNFLEHSGIRNLSSETIHKIGSALLEISNSPQCPLSHQESASRAASILHYMRSLDCSYQEASEMYTNRTRRFEKLEQRKPQ